jgi:hypothetical protein
VHDVLPVEYLDMLTSRSDVTTWNRRAYGVGQAELNFDDKRPLAKLYSAAASTAFPSLLEIANK